jgi:hypothetical protein
MFCSDSYIFFWVTDELVMKKLVLPFDALLSLLVLKISPTLKTWDDFPKLGRLVELNITHSSDAFPLPGKEFPDEGGSAIIP